MIFIILVHYFLYDIFVIVNERLLLKNGFTFTCSYVIWWMSHMDIMLENSALYVSKMYLLLSLLWVHPISSLILYCIYMYILYFRIDSGFPCSPLAVGLRTRIIVHIHCTLPILYILHCICTVYTIQYPHYCICYTVYALYILYFTLIVYAMLCMRCICYTAYAILYMLYS